MLRLASSVSFLLSHYPTVQALWFRLLPFRSPLLWESLLLSLPPATKMFQFAGFARTSLYIQLAVFGLPHSDTSGSSLVASSPKLFVGHHVLLRLCVPRYPPLALGNLTKFFSTTYFLLFLMQFSRCVLDFLPAVHFLWLLTSFPR